MKPSNNKLIHPCYRNRIPKFTKKQRGFLKTRIGCPHCTGVFTSVTWLRQHVKMHHGCGVLLRDARRMFRCINCNPRKDANLTTLDSLRGPFNWGEVILHLAQQHWADTDKQRHFYKGWYGVEPDMNT